MWVDLLGAFAFLTILPIKYTSSEKPGRIFAYFPLVGLLIGAAVSLVASITFLPRDVVAFMTLTGWVGLTGALHLDGFGDSCDGLLATVTPERRLEIMKDPRAGAYAVVGLVLLLLGKWVALREVAPLLLILPPVMGRWAMVLAAYAFPYARSSGMGGYFREGFGRAQVLFATIITCVVALAFGWPRLLILVIAPLTVAFVGRWAASRLGGGLTGDVYGALCELTELLCLLILTITI
jgi:adenosylcobinamide-GDP ribazoletransferase